MKNFKISEREKAFILKGRKILAAAKKSRHTTYKRVKSKPSKGELEVMNFLKGEGVNFWREYYMTGCYSSKGNLLYFDFWLPEYNLCIEFDGEFHYRKNKSESEKENDFRKNAFCLKNGIHLLRIKYTDIEKTGMLICQKIDKIKPNS
jgi:hypothetical protein